MVTFITSSGDLSSNVELTCADDATLFYRNHEYPLVADLTHFCRGHDRVDDVIDAIVRDDNLDLHLGQQAHLVFAAAIHGGIAALVSVTAHLRHRHPEDAVFRECVLNVVNLVRSDDYLE